MLEDCSPMSWFNRRGFIKSRKILLLIMMVCGQFIILGYKSTLRASLIVIKYEDGIDSIQDAAESGLSFVVPSGVGAEVFYGLDPRPLMKQIWSRHTLYPYSGKVPQDVWDGYVISLQRHKSTIFYNYLHPCFFLQVCRGNWFRWYAMGSG